ncbi:ParB/RepB/Spo0J family partition protein [Herbaspirillum sp. HC18]|nr:ParB/RepB/Spo0J family partition protein [Herbaspirillum sp. HC18]
MSIKDLKNKTASVAARHVERAPSAEPKTGPVRMYDITARMHEAERRVTELEAQLKDAGGELELDLDLLVEKSGRKRNLSETQFQELVDNLRNNRLVTPISVRSTGTGKYEIISGHNRVQAFRQLGRKTIPAYVQDVEHKQADIDAFFANLLQPSLPDYEKYLGFCVIKRHRPHMTQEEIGDMAGISRQQVSRLMTFAALPSDALAALDQNPRALGANAAAELASIAKTGKHEAVIKAIQQLVTGELDQAKAVEQAMRTMAVKAVEQAMLAATPDAEKPVKQKVEPRLVKQGRGTYCSLRRTDKTIRLDFKSPEEAAAIEQAILDLIETRAKKTKEDD